VWLDRFSSLLATAHVEPDLDPDVERAGDIGGGC
jgi:hypothetical protein